MRNLIFILLMLIPIGCFAQGEWGLRQDFLAGAQLGDDTGASGIATIDSMVFTGVNIGMWSGGVKYNLLEGSLASPATITGTEVNYLSIKMSDAGDRSAWFIFRPADGLGVWAYSGDAYDQDSSFFRVDSNLVSMGIYDGGAEKSIMMDTVDATGIQIRDDDAGVGLRFYADYSPAYVARNATDYEYQGTHLGYQDLNSTVYNPGDAEHGDVMTWDTATDQYIMTDVVAVAEAAGIMIVTCDTILYDDTTIDTAAVLPVAAIVWDIQVYVKTAFTGTGTDLLDIGIDGSGERYEADLDMSVADQWYGVANVSDRMAATTEIIYQYFDANTDAGAGEAYIYVHYSIH